MPASRIYYNDKIAKLTACYGQADTHAVCFANLESHMLEWQRRWRSNGAVKGWHCVGGIVNPAKSRVSLSPERGGCWGGVTS